MYRLWAQSTCLYEYIYMYTLYIHLCKYVCIHIHTYIFIYTHAYIYTYRSAFCSRIHMLNIKLVIYIIFDRWCMYLHSYQDIHTYRYIHISCMYIYIHKYICTIMCKYVHVCNIYTQASTLGAQRFVRGSTCWKSNWAMTSSTRYTFQHTATHCNTLQHTELNKVHILKNLLRGHFTSSLRYWSNLCEFPSFSSGAASSSTR